MLSALFASLALAAQVTFSSPVHYEVTLAGNFGEPRPNHFHGGIDVKTGQVEGKAMLSIGDGYVSQVTVGMYGFGNAVYVRHPQGYTSVYCHLKAFSPRVKAVLRRHQYLSRQSKGCFRFKPYEVPVAQGDIIAQRLPRVTSSPKVGIQVPRKLHTCIWSCWTIVLGPSTMPCSISQGW